MHLPQIIIDLYAAHPVPVIVIGIVAFGGFLGRHSALTHSFQQRFPLILTCVELICAPVAFICFYVLVCQLFHLFPTFNVNAWSPALFAFLLSFVISWYVAKTIHAFINRKYIASRSSTTQRKSLSGLFRGLIYGTCLLVGATLFFLSQGYSFTGVWVSTGLVTALVGLALQQTLGDFFSGMALSLEGSFRIGDRLRLEDDTEGEVVDVNWRATWLHDWDNTTHIIPNAKLAKQGFTNLGSEYNYYSPWYYIQLPAEIDPRFAKQLLLEGIYRCKHVLKHPPPVVRLTDASTVPYTYMFWVYFPNYAAMFRGREEVYREIHYVLQKAGVTPAAAIQEWRTRRAAIPVAEPPTIHLALKSQEIFAGMEDEEIEKLSMICQQIHYDAGSSILLEAGDSDALDIVISGVIELSTQLPDGKQISIREMAAGECFGLISMFTDQPTFFQRVAQTDVTLIRIKIEDMRTLLQEHPELADRIAAVVKQNLDEAEYLRMKGSSQPAPSSLKEIKRYIRQMMKRDERK